MSKLSPEYFGEGLHLLSWREQGKWQFLHVLEDYWGLERKEVVEHWKGMTDQLYAETWLGGINDF